MREFDYGSLNIDKYYNNEHPHYNFSELEKMIIMGNERRIMAPTAAN